MAKSGGWNRLTDTLEGWDDDDDDRPPWIGWNAEDGDWRRLSPQEMNDARELELFFENDADLYRQQILSIQANLRGRAAKGEYDPLKAEQLWKYAADNAARSYGNEFGQGRRDGLRMFNPTIRREIARRAARFFEQTMIDEGDPWENLDALREQAWMGIPAGATIRADEQITESGLTPGDPQVKAPVGGEKFPSDYIHAEPGDSGWIQYSAPNELPTARFDRTGTATIIGYTEATRLRRAKAARSAASRRRGPGRTRSFDSRSFDLAGIGRQPEMRAFATQLRAEGYNARVVPVSPRHRRDPFNYPTRSGAWNTHAVYATRPRGRR